jgi:putative endopeptidase
VTLRTLLVLPVAALCACAREQVVVRPATPAAAPAPVAPAGVRGVDLAAMDPSVKPGDDFYDFANGTFMRTAEIPPDRASTGAFRRVADVVEERTRAIVEGAARVDAPAGSDARKIGDLYGSFMDEAGIEAKGLAPLRPTLARIAALADARALAAELGGTVRADVDIFNCTNLTTSRPLGVFIEQDLNEPSRNTVYLVQGGLGLPDRDFYRDGSPRMAEIRARYRAHLEKLFALAAVPDASARAERVLAFETKLAGTHGSREDAADARKSNHPWTRAELEQHAPGMDWGAFLRAAALERQPGFIAWQPTALVGLAALVKAEPLATWKDYLAARALDRSAPFLSKAFADESFAFHGTVLTGTPQQRARWKRAITVVDLALGDAVGRIYVQRHFPPEAKAEIQGMVKNIRDAFARRIDALDWMAPATKARAKEKLAGLEVGIGYPDRWIDYGALEIVKGDLLGDVERAELFEYRRQRAKLGKAPDRGDWCMLPHEVNAVNLPVRNALEFPAGYMEPPFYDREATPAVKYASIGATIGHEISHAFDDQGALFDARGKLENWWTPADFARFEAAGQKLVAQYDAYKPFPDAAVNGKLTLSENIADLAGLAAAHDAWRAALAGAPPPRVGNLDGEQQFFVGFAQSWQTKEREPALRQQLLTDGHAPARYRALTVRNLDPWYIAFDVQRGQALFLAPGERVRVW